SPAFSSLSPPPPRPTLFPYTTLFRSRRLRVPRRRRTRFLDAVHRRVDAGPRLRALDRDGRMYRRLRRAGDSDAVARTRNARHARSEEHTSELQSPYDLVCRLLLEKKK